MIYKYLCCLGILVLTIYNLPHVFGQVSQNQTASDALGASILTQIAPSLLDDPILRAEDPIPPSFLRNDPILRADPFPPSFLDDPILLEDPFPTVPPPPPQISITEAYANGGTQNNGIFHPQKRISQGDVVYQGQSLQFREDFTGPDAKITKVYCAIDNNWAYNEQCSGFEGNSYGWILNAGIPTNNLRDGHHTYTVVVDTENGRTNYATFDFRLTHEVLFD